jgi:hypothetical protein
VFTQNTQWIKPLARYDAKHHKSTSFVNIPKTLREEFTIDGKQKK